MKNRMSLVITSGNNSPDMSQYERFVIDSQIGETKDVE